MSARTTTSSIFFGDDSTPANKPSSFAPSATESEGSSAHQQDLPASTTTDFMMLDSRPSTTNEVLPKVDSFKDKTKNLVDSPPTEPSSAKISSFKADKEKSPQAGSKKQPLYSGLTGGVQSQIFEPETGSSKSKSSKESNVSNDSVIAYSPPSSIRPGAALRSGGGPSRVFDVEKDGIATFTGRKVEARHNTSQVALGGGYPDSEPPKRAPCRGKIRKDYNQSQISFGDDSNSNWMAVEKSRRSLVSQKIQDQMDIATTSGNAAKRSNNSSSQIVFGDDTNGAVIKQKTVRKDEVTSVATQKNRPNSSDDVKNDEYVASIRINSKYNNHPVASWW